MEQLFDWQGWRGLEDVILLLAIPGLLWIWTKLDHVKKEAQKDAASQVASAFQQVLTFKSDGDRVHADQWKAISDLQKQFIDLMRELHSQELYGRDHYVTHKTLDDAMESMMDRIGVRFDGLQEQFKNLHASVEHLARIKAPRG